MSLLKKMRWTITRNSSKLIPEDSDFTEVHSILIVNEGNNYDQLPTTSITSTNGNCICYVK